MRDAERDLKAMKDRDSWPRWPWLPLIKRTGDSTRDELAVLYASEPFQLVYTNLFQLPHSQKEFEQMKHEDVTPEKLVADGWEVD